MSGIRIDVLAAKASAVLQDGKDFHTIEVMIVGEGNDVFAILKGDQCLDVRGHWSPDLSASKQTADWKRTHRFTTYPVAVSRASAALRAWADGRPKTN